MKANHHPTRPESVPAVAYLRRSTSRQEKSLTDQRTEIERYALQQGYRILRWYEDDGISGDATECRVRIVKHRGDWPEELPQLKNQFLAAP